MEDVGIWWKRVEKDECKVRNYREIERARDRHTDRQRQ